MKTKEEIFCKHLCEYVPCEQKNVVLTYVETNVILKAMEEYAQHRVEEATRWIQVSERLPEEDGRYWCYVREVNDLGISYYQWNCAYSSNSVSKWSDNLRSKDVTHWQPLPKAPTV